MLKAIKNRSIKANIVISGSKSETNRLLILQRLFSNISIENLSDSDDSVYMQNALSTCERVINIGHAGTAMRFLTSYFSIYEGREVVLTGSERMRDRPIKLLIDTLNYLGAEIKYEKKTGYPPIKIKGKKIVKNTAKISGGVSSQYISSILLVASKLEKGLELELVGKITSTPYINMTLSLLRSLGIEVSFKGSKIKVLPKLNIKNQNIIIESDWSSASYFYSIISSSAIGSEIVLSTFKKDSLQGDSCLANIYNHFGVRTVFTNSSIILKKVEKSNINTLNLDLITAPDIAQTIAVTCFSEGVGCNLTGLHTLKIKETDRLIALDNELKKLGADISVSNKSLHLKPSTKINSNISIETYNDHRMAMAFAPLSMKTSIKIKDSEVVTKSYKKFWDDIKQIGIKITTC